MEGKWAQYLWVAICILGIAIGLVMCLYDQTWSISGWSSATGQGELISIAFSVASSVVEGPILIYMLKTRPWRAASGIDKGAYVTIMSIIIYDVGTNWLGIFPQSGTGVLSSYSALVTTMKIFAGIFCAFAEYFIAYCMNSLKYHVFILGELSSE